MADRVPIGELKARLSEYVRRAHAGQALIVTDRGTPVARLGPLAGNAAMDGRLEELADAGLVRRPTRPLPADFLDTARPADPEGGSVRAILEERAESR